MDLMLMILLGYTGIIISSVSCYDILNKCVKDGVQKPHPSPEINITGVCETWKKNACCTSAKAKDIEEKNYSHCGVKTTDECKHRFMKVSCLLQCSSNLGYWTKTRDTDKSSEEKPQYIPISYTECNEWWKDCLHDYICVGDWETEFHRNSTGLNACEKNSKCEKIYKVFHSAIYFCEHVIGPFKFLVVNDNVPHISIFTAVRNNDKAASYYQQNIQQYSGDGAYEEYPYHTANLHPANNPEDQFNTVTKPLFIAICVIGVVMALGGVICCVTTKYRQKLSWSKSARFLYSPHMDDNEVALVDLDLH